MSFRKRSQPRDDVEQRSSSALAPSSPASGWSRRQRRPNGGLRFKRLDIPQGAVITRAYIQFKTDEVSNGTASLVIPGQDSDTAAGSAASPAFPRARRRTPRPRGRRRLEVVGAAGAAQRILT